MSKAVRDGVSTSKTRRCHTRLVDGDRAAGQAEREAPARRIADPLDAMVSRWLSV